MSRSGSDSALFGAWPGFLVALLLTVGAVWVQTPLNLDRPPESKADLAAAGLQDVDARLWQDPFGAVGEARKRPPPTADGCQPDRERGHALPWLAGQVAARRALDGAGRLEVVAMMVSGGPSIGAAEWRRRFRYAALAGLMLEGFQPDDAEHLGYVDLGDQAPPDYVPFEWFTRPAKGQPRQDLLLLWVDEDGLVQTPKALLETCTVAPTPSPGTAAPGPGATKQVTDPGVNPGGQPRVQNSPRPLARLSALLGELVSTAGAGARDVRFQIIGPGGSTTLQAIASEVRAVSRGTCPGAPSPTLAAAMWSPFATLPDDYAEIEESAPPICACGKSGVCVAISPPAPERRTIADDRVLVNLLVDELIRRQVTGNAGVALVGQWDTAYSRTLAELFQQAWGARHPAAITPGTGQRLFAYSYLRGLDGAIPGATPRDAGGAPGKGIERAAGDAQLDYLRRMRDALLERDAQLRAACGLGERFRQECGVRAIGVLGNDYFDKLLVLQALKPVFGNAVFFTTDLNADMFHPQDNVFTRNLIVASGFGLTLRADLQGEAAPLRDNYQTALLLAVRLALGSEPGRDIRLPPPARLFELGRSHAVELVDPDLVQNGDPLRPAPRHRSAGDGPAQGVAPAEDPHPADELSAHFRMLSRHDSWVFPLALGLGLVLALVLAILTLGPAAVRRVLGRWWRGLTCGWLPTAVALFSLVLVIALAVIAGRDIAAGGEPFSLIQGVSIWPAEVLRLIAGLAAVVFLILGHDRMCRARARIERDFGLSQDPDVTPGPNPGPNQEPIPDRVPTRIGEATPDSRPPEQPATAGVESAIGGPAGPAGGDTSMGPVCCGDLLQGPDASRDDAVPPRPALSVWRCYMAGCRLLPHWLDRREPVSPVPSDCRTGWGSQAILTRVLPGVILFLLLAQALMLALGFPNRPVRSLASWEVDLALVLLVLVPFLGLLFYMVDATRQTLDLARTLAGPVAWPRSRLERFGLARWTTSNPAGQDQATDIDWLDVHLIARVTRPVGDLVWYPVLVLILLALARHPLFDAWNLPPSLLIVMLIVILYTVGCAWALRIAAERVRTAAVRKLQLARLRAQGQGGMEVCIAQLDTMLKAISEEREGAFRPFSQQPVVQALLTLASSISGLALIEYSALVNL